MKFCRSVPYHINGIYVKFEVFVCDRIGLMKRQSEGGPKIVVVESKNFDGMVFGGYCSSSNKI